MGWLLAVYTTLGPVHLAPARLGVRRAAEGRKVAAKGARDACFAARRPPARPAGEMARPLRCLWSWRTTRATLASLPHGAKPPQSGEKTDRAARKPMLSASRSGSALPLASHLISARESAQQPPRITLEAGEPNCPVHKSSHHSHTLPTMSEKPQGFGANRPTSNGPGSDIEPLHQQCLAASSGFSSSLQNHLLLEPPRQQCSHSDSVGNLRSAFWRKLLAAFQDTPDAGIVDRLPSFRY